MPEISIELAATGMKLAKPVANRRGMVLYGSGVVLTDDILARLCKLGIERITVAGRSLPTANEEKSISQQSEDLNARFRYVEDDPLMSKIKDLILEQLKERAEGA